ncbi:MAG: DUF6364 family protein [Arcobacteraceae bacterium]|nr:DUF6364 family protein [Arcobacteraceae bacterium]
MSAKITLYTEQEIIEEVKKFAKEHKTSVSKLVNNYFKSLLEKEKIEIKNKNTQITDSLYGTLKSVKLDENDYKTYLEEKYL